MRARADVPTPARPTRGERASSRRWMCAATVARSSAPKRSATLTTKVRPSQPQRTRTCACAASVTGVRRSMSACSGQPALVARRVVDGVEHELVGGGLDAAQLLVADAEAAGVGEQRRQRLVLVQRAADDALLERRAGEQIGRRSGRLRRALEAAAQRQAELLLVGPFDSRLALGFVGRRLAPRADLGHAADDVAVAERLHQPLARVEPGHAPRSASACRRRRPAHTARWAASRDRCRGRAARLRTRRARARQERRTDGLSRTKDWRRRAPAPRASASTRCRETIAARPSERTPLDDTPPLAYFSTLETTK